MRTSDRQLLIAVRKPAASAHGGCLRMKSKSAGRCGCRKSGRFYQPTQLICVEITRPIAWKAQIVDRTSTKGWPRDRLLHNVIFRKCSDSSLCLATGSSQVFQSRQAAKSSLTLRRRRYFGAAEFAVTVRCLLISSIPKRAGLANKTMGGGARYVIFRVLRSGSIMPASGFLAMTRTAKKCRFRSRSVIIDVVPTHTNPAPHQRISS